MKEKIKLETATADFKSVHGPAIYIIIGKQFTVSP